MTQATKTLNGLDMEALDGLVRSVQDDPAKGMVGFGVTTRWAGGTRSQTDIRSWQMGGESHAKDFQVTIDEPPQLLGEDTAPNPQEMLMAAMNACMMVGYVAAASGEGIELESLEIQTEGELDLRGFLGLDATVAPGYETLKYTVRIKGNGSQEQFQKVHETVMATSPNRYNIRSAIKLDGRLIVD